MTSSHSRRYETVDEPTVEPKVAAAPFGAGASGVVAGFVLYLLGTLIWHGQESLVPLPVQQLVLLVVPSAGAFLSGWYARHVNR
jgi:hypothetical protein